MAGTSVKDIVSDVILELSQVPGVSTQLYSSGIIQKFVQDAFLLEMEEMFWPQYMAYFTVGLDGSTGAITSDLAGPIASVTEYGDIAIAWPEGSNRRLKELPPGINPSTIVGGSPIYMNADYALPARPMRVYPTSSTGNVIIWARQRPKLPFDLTDTLHLDRLLLTYDAAWMYCVDDGSVPFQVTKFQMLATKRRIQTKAALTQQPLALDPRYPDVSADDPWFVLDADPLA